MTGVAAYFAAGEAPYALALRFGDVPIAVRTNHPDVQTRLRRYFSPFVVRGVGDERTEVTLMQGIVEPRGCFLDVQRGPGKRVKEAVQEVAGGRLILKRSTGVLMGLEPGSAYAQGDLLTNLNQAVNLINAAYAKRVLRRGHVLFHASAVTRNGGTAVLAGAPGAGKSSSALHLLEDGFRFLSNDRVLALAGSDHVEVLGYPKQPRVNPGTLVRHPRLVALLTAEDRNNLATLSPEELWLLERKCDVDLDAIYGSGTVALSGSMRCLILLKWRLKGGAFVVRRLRGPEALLELPLFYKDLGAFDLDQPSTALGMAGKLSSYAAILDQVAVLEVSGGVDFPSLVSLVRDALAT